MRQFYVYIMASKSGTLYTGVTNDLYRRVQQHKQRLVKGFSAKYHTKRLVYYEATDDVRGAILMEKQIKAWRRSKKIALIESTNPTWNDLAEAWW
jgi:putative endonuclease